MNQYLFQPISKKICAGVEISVFEIGDENIDQITVDSFGEEWSKFHSFTESEIQHAGDQYFDLVTSQMLNRDSLVLDMGCGTGRWTKYVAGKAGFVEAIDPSKAVLSAAYLLKEQPNIRITQTSVSNIPFRDESFDFVFSLGVLHHIPDTRKAMQETVRKLKKGGYFLVYLYYNLDNRGSFFKGLFYLSNLLRRTVSRMPAKRKKAFCELLVILLYLPFVYTARFFRLIGLKKIAAGIPLSYYADKSLHIIRNDCLDRFGTPLEQRFSKMEIAEMMKTCGLAEIRFSEKEPFWHAIGRKVRSSEEQD